MLTSTFTLFLNIVGLIVFGVLGLWMWGVFRFSDATQAQMEHTFARSKKRFRILMPLAAAACIYGLYKAMIA